MKCLLLEISHDLGKAGRGNKAAAQRVRINTIQFAKVAKTYRKESIAEGKTGKKRKGVRKKAAKRKTTARKKPAKKKTARRKRRR